MGWKSRGNYAVRASICVVCGKIHYEEHRQCKECKQSTLREEPTEGESHD